MAPRKSPGTEVVNWEDQMAKDAQVAANNTRAMGTGGSFFSMAAGTLAFGGNPMPGNQMAVVILGSIMENSYYEGDYDANTPASPKCFAFNTDEDELEPHPDVDKVDYFERQNDVCAGCPQNEWGSARTGRGKACKNVVRLAIIPAGQYKAKGVGRNAGLDLELFDDPDIFAKAETAYLKLPVMSVKNFNLYVKQLAGETNRPPWGVITNIAIEPDVKSQFKVVFELLEPLEPDMLNVTMPRHKREMETIDFPYGPPMADAPVEPTKANNKLKRPAAKPAAKKPTR